MSHLLETKAANLASCKTHIPFISAFVHCSSHTLLAANAELPRQLSEEQEKGNATGKGNWRFLHNLIKETLLYPSGLLFSILS